MSSYPQPARGPWRDCRADPEGPGDGALPLSACREVRGDSEGQAQRAAGDMPVPRKLTLSPHPPSLGVPKA